MLEQQSSSLVLNSRDYGKEMRDSVDFSSMRRVAEEMQQDLDAKENEIAQLRI